MYKTIKVNEWKDDKKWNPFNSYKLLTHVDRWKNIIRGNEIPPPILITIDPSNICNYRCYWCNSSYVMSKQSNMLTEKNIEDIVKLISTWKLKEYSVKSVCIAGGGEPLLNPNTGLLIDLLVENNIKVAVVTNGYLIDRFLEPLSKCVWVGVSVDAGTKDTYNRIKGLSLDSNSFDKVIENIKNLITYAKKNNTTLSKDNISYGVSYKYLLSRDNIHEIYEAASKAKEIGCKNFHLRPASNTWDKLNQNRIKFTKNDIKTYNKQIKQAFEIDDEKFSIFGITHKFDGQFNICNRFERCYAIFMTALLTPSDKEGKVDLCLCCDRRGDRMLTLKSRLDNLEEVKKVWGGETHWSIFDKINVKHQCPRCTYQPHNQIYEQVIINDNMTHEFI